MNKIELTRDNQDNFCKQKYILQTWCYEYDKKHLQTILPTSIKVASYNTAYSACFEVYSDEAVSLKDYAPARLYTVLTMQTLAVNITQRQTIFKIIQNTQSKIS